MGNKRAVYRTDQERSVISLLNAAKILWGGELVPEEAARGESTSNAVAESGVRVHEGLTRTYKIGLEKGWAK